MALSGHNRLSDMPGTSIPLLVQDLNGATRQLDVPTSATADYVQKLIIGENGTDANDSYKLAINGTEIQSGVPLTDTTVVPAYNVATSLLQVIGSSRLEPGKTAEALSSVNGVIRQVSNGVTDVNALCAAAGRSLDDAIAGVGDGSDNEMYQAGAMDTAEAIPPNWSDASSPAVLVRRLSQTLPQHFDVEASHEFVRKSLRGSDLAPGGIEIGDLDASAFTPSNQGNQPKISDIARARRMRKSLSDEDNALLGTGNFSGPGRDNLAVPSLDIAAQSAAAAASGFGKMSAVVAESGQSTWMDNVINTWAVGLVRKSGELEKSPDGLKLKSHIDALEDNQERTTTSNDDKGDTMNLDNQPNGTDSFLATMQPGLQRQPPPANVQQDAQALAAMMTGMGSTTHTTATPSGSSVSSPSMRRATPIAPSPLPLTGPGAGGTAVSGASAVVGPIKRGRKLKNPDLTPDQRKQMRKEQKRRSARESRIRKKTLENDYQQKLKILISENGTLKKQVTDLTHRLQVLQGLLTVTVRPVNPNALPRPQPPQMPGITTGPPGLGNPHASIGMPGVAPSLNPAALAGAPMPNGNFMNPPPPHRTYANGMNPFASLAQQHPFSNRIPNPTTQPPFRNDIPVSQPMLQRSHRASFVPIRVPNATKHS